MVICAVHAGLWLLEMNADWVNSVNQSVFSSTVGESVNRGVHVMK